MLDTSPRRNSNGQSLAIHKTQMGKDSPTFAYTSEIKDHSANFSNLGWMFSNSAHRLHALNPSIPITTVYFQHIDLLNSNAHFYMDWLFDGDWSVFYHEHGTVRKVPL